MSKKIVREQWGTRFGYLMAVVGAMVGAGNLWRMPYVAGENGGGAFLLAYFLLLYLIAVPGLMGEASLGRYAKKSVVGTFRHIFGNSRWAGLGLVILIVNIALMSYYSSVVGWTIYYAFHSVIGTFTSEGFDAVVMWEEFSSNPMMSLAMHTIAMIIITGILVFGIKKGIERTVKWMIPILAVSLVIIAVRGLTLPGAIEGLQFSFSPSWEYLAKSETWLAALGQALFSTGLGWGIALTYGSYLSDKDDIPLGGGLFTAIGDTSFGLLAIFAIFPIVFAFGMSPSSGAQLAFVALGSAFDEMAFGYIFALLFFISFLFANITSGVAITEVGVSSYFEGKSISRGRATITVCGIIWLLGIPSAIDVSILGYLDFVVGNWGLPLSTVLIMLTVGWKFDAWRMRVVDLNRASDMHVRGIWEFSIKCIIPIVMIAIMLYFMVSNFQTSPVMTITGIGLIVVTVAACLWIAERGDGASSMNESLELKNDN